MPITSTLADAEAMSINPSERLAVFDSHDQAIAILSRLYGAGKIASYHTIAQRGSNTVRAQTRLTSNGYCGTWRDVTIDDLERAGVSWPLQAGTRPKIQRPPRAKPGTKIVPLRPDTTAEQREAALTDLIANMVRMSSVLSSLLEDRIRDTGERSLTLDRQDAADIQFIAGQVAAYAEQVRTAWEKI